MTPLPQTATADRAPIAGSPPKPVPDRKLEIERAALNLAYLHGPDKVYTGMIAAEIGLSQPAIYKHFKRKQDIWQAVATSLARQIWQNIAASQQMGKPPVEALRLLARLHLEFLHNNPALPEIMAMRTKAGTQSGFQITIQAAMKAFHQGLARLVQQGQAQNDFRQNISPTDAATLVLGVIQSLVLRSLISRDLDILKSDGERLINLLLEGFAQQGTAQ